MPFVMIASLFPSGDESSMKTPHGSPGRWATRAARARRIRLHLLGLGLSVLSGPLMNAVPADEITLDDLGLSFPRPGPLYIGLAPA